MNHPEAVQRLEQLELEAEAARDKIAGYRRSMLGSRVGAWAGAAILGAAVTIAPAPDTVALVLTALAISVGSLIWLGTTKASKEELEVRLRDLTQERDALFDRIAAANGWAPNPITTTRH